jgi:membrane peptidoglycan carboxypeptidase
MSLPSSGQVVAFLSAARTRTRRLPGPKWLWAVAAVVVLGVVLLGYELRTSRLQAWYFSRRAARLTFALDSGPSPAIQVPRGGPYDQRHGYSDLPRILQALGRNGFDIDSQVRQSPAFIRLLESGAAPIYRAKDQAGLVVLDRRGSTLFDGRYPARVYPEFAAIPVLVWRTLLYVEDRNLLAPPSPWYNPAVNWRRLFRATLDYGLRSLGGEGSVAGASTVATQLEKFRHWPDGRTRTARDKLLQMHSASLRAYLDGPETGAAWRWIVTSYLNSMPLAGLPGTGEVTGLADGLRFWFGADFDLTNRLLNEAVTLEGRLEADSHGRAYRQVLYLILAVQRPSYFLADSAGREALARRAEQYLAALTRDGVISDRLADAARRAQVTVQPTLPAPPASYVERKAAQAVRTELLALSGLPSLYRLDRLDAVVQSTIDEEVQNEVTRFFQRLGDPQAVEALGLTQPPLLDRGDPSAVRYALLLLERTPSGNLVRVQADNVDAPFSPIEGAKLELGSTAKLRTLVTYLEAVERAYGELQETIAEPRHDSVAVLGDDPITTWVRQQVAARPAIQLDELLAAAMERRYSADPRERFFTGGGVHSFRNFETSHDRQDFTVRAAFRHSVNLVFIRLMRDLVEFYINRLPGQPATALTDRQDPRRLEYLARFADREGRVFLDQFLRKHQWTSRQEALAALVRDRSLTPQRLAWLFRSVVPTATVDEFAAFLAQQDQENRTAPERVRELFNRADPSRRSLVDRAFLAGVHPLELWLVEFRLRHPTASRAEVMDSSRDVRQEVYRWLFATRRARAQDQRIRSVLEIEAFFEIHKEWQRLGYPFPSLVPSYATAIGSSADRPEQLAELVGILLNDGKRLPVVRVDRVALARGTPYETVLRHRPPQEEQVLSPAVARVVREAMLDVVEQGTARRAWGAVRGPDGVPLAVGAKTGTGNNRFRVFGRGGRIIVDRALNRTATLVFFIGDRFYGTLTAFVVGPEADQYTFTSSLPAQILRLLGPVLEKLVRQAEPSGT